ncbi:MAG TPA: hypothetical protein VNV66_13800 [Pilimelia sp.]|nr:hypothetical protein [Pilimelia sp.]
MGVALPAGAATAAEPTPGREGTPTLREVLEAAARGYVDAKAALDRSRKRQRQLTGELARIETRLQEISVEVGAVAATSYRTGRIGVVTALLSAASPDAFLARASAADLIAQRDDAQLRELHAARAAQATAKAAIDREVATQRRQVAVMKKRQDDAVRALAEVGGQATGGFVSATSPLAKPAPRNPDGSWPRESCIIDDPTTSGCLTPRTLHALRQAQAVGFRRYVSCFRTGDAYEHPKGRACDFAAQVGGFGGHAAGDDRRYGNDLAAFFVRNADRLGVLYVIWYRQIWFPGSGWRAYSGGGDPASAHTNHVHLSVY